MNWKNSSLASMANTLYKSIRFHDFFKSHFKFAMQCSIRKARKKQKRRIELISQKKKIKVAFMFQTPAVWKYDRLYRLMENSDVFDPIVVLTPYNVNLFYDRAETMRVMEQSALYVEKNQYRFISAYDTEAKRWVDVKKLIDPDVVFFSKPYKDTLYLLRPVWLFHQQPLQGKLQFSFPQSTVAIFCRNRIPKRSFRRTCGRKRRKHIHHRMSADGKPDEERLHPERCLEATAKAKETCHLGAAPHC